MIYYLITPVIYSQTFFTV